MNRLIEWLRTDLLVFRSSGLGCLVLAFLCAGAVFTALGFAGISMSKRKTTPEIATITGFGVSESRWHAGYIAVSARDSKGIVATVLVQASDIAGCHVGDKMRAGRYGLALDLDPAPCPITLASGEEGTSRGK